MHDVVRNALSVKIKTAYAVKRGYDDWWLKQFLRDRRNRMTVISQRINVEEHQKYGSDMAVSRFIIRTTGGQVRDQRGIWLSKYKELPPDYSKNFKVTAIKASHSVLTTEGVDNLVGLDYVESIDLSYNYRLDDFSCDQLARQFRKSKTLKYIDLSHNPLITLNGLDILFRIPSLKQLIAINTRASEHEHIDLFALSAEDERGCQVICHEDGRQFKSAELEALRLDLPAAARLASSSSSPDQQRQEQQVTSSNGAGKT